MHTPGPWRVQSFLQEGWLIVENRSRCVCRCYAYKEGHANDMEQEANARLIAAAPDLLEALEECRGQLALIESKSAYEQPFVLRLIARADAAIAKAKGGEA